MTTFFAPRAYRLSAAGLVLLASLSVLGCGSGQSVYPVQGQIVYADGTPATDLAGCTVTFESVDQAATAERGGIGAWGEVQADGTFTIGTYKPDDGAVAGRHRVAISPAPDMREGMRSEPPISLKYATVENSGLEAEVTRGKNSIELKIERK